MWRWEKCRPSVAAVPSVYLRGCFPSRRSERAAAQMRPTVWPVLPPIRFRCHPTMCPLARSCSSLFFCLLCGLLAVSACNMPIQIVPPSRFRLSFGLAVPRMRVDARLCLPGPIRSPFNRRFLLNVSGIPAREKNRSSFTAGIPACEKIVQGVFQPVNKSFQLDCYPRTDP